MSPLVRQSEALRLLIKAIYYLLGAMFVFMKGFVRGLVGTYRGFLPFSFVISERRKIMKILLDKKIICLILFLTIWRGIFGVILESVKIFPWIVSIKKVL